MPPIVTQNDAEHRFEIPLASGTGILNYVRTGNQLRLVHTEVPKKDQGQGYAGQLVRFALEYAKHEGLRVIPICPYVQSYLTRHPEYASLVDAAS